MFKLTLFASLCLCLFANAALAQNYVDKKGREWRRLDARPTLQLSVAAAVSVCSQDPCRGVAGGVDLTGWTWANHYEVIELMREFNSAAPIDYTTLLSAQKFQKAMGITYQSSGQYATIVTSTGLTSSIDLKTKLPLVGAVYYMNYFGQPGDGTYVVGTGSASSVSGRGVFLYRRR